MHDLRHRRPLPRRVGPARPDNPGDVAGGVGGDRGALSLHSDAQEDISGARLVRPRNCSSENLPSDDSEAVSVARERAFLGLQHLSTREGQDRGRTGLGLSKRDGSVRDVRLRLKAGRAKGP